MERDPQGAWLEKAAAAASIVAVALFLNFHRQPDEAPAPPPAAAGTAGMDSLWRDSVASRPMLQKPPAEGLFPEEPRAARPASRRAAAPPPAPRPTPRVEPEPAPEPRPASPSAAKVVRLRAKSFT
ncbi:MAG TPA: hypothetical protein VNI01_04745, partial [Elusimicrobiota bacterium]|nr:hypothetical protein [Elusimicrobiota bacterium]